MAPRRREVPSHKGDAATLLLEAAVSVLLAGVLCSKGGVIEMLNGQESGVWQAKSPCVGSPSSSYAKTALLAAHVVPVLAAAVLTICTLTFVLCFSEASLARQGVVQGHCLVPTLLVVLLRYRYDSLRLEHFRYWAFNVGSIVLCCGANLGSIWISRLCSRSGRAKRSLGPAPPGVPDKDATSKIGNLSLTYILICMAGVVYLSQVLGLSSMNHSAFIVGLYSVLHHGMLGSEPLMRSFTMGESNILSQLLSLLISDVCFLFVSSTMKFGALKRTGISSTAWPKASDRSHLSLVIEFGLAGTICILIFLGPVVLSAYEGIQRVERRAAEREAKDKVGGDTGKYDEHVDGRLVDNRAKRISSWRSRMAPRSTVCFYFTLVCGIFLVSIACTFVLGKEPLTWVFAYILSDSSHVYLLFYWILLLLPGIAIIGSPEETSVLPQIIHRKLFHLLALALFVPGLFFGADFLRLSLAVAMSLLLIVEVLRLGRVPPFGTSIHNYMKMQVDSRDKDGPLFLTHLYLLAGCAMPLWLSSLLLVAPSRASNAVVTCFSAAQYISLLAGAAGLTATGVGDAMGAIVGTSFQKSHRISGTRKSFEGSAAMFASIVVFSGLLSGNIFVVCSDASVIFSALVCTIVEACTTTIDNMVLPLVLMTTIVLANM